MDQSLLDAAHSWSLISVFAVFLGILAFALWPSNQKKFDEAARLPLNED